MMRRLSRVLAMALLAAPLTAQHASHRLPPIPLDILERPTPIRTGIGRAHDDAGTPVRDAQALYDQGLAHLHAYAWIEAARSFNAALRADPELALANVGLSVAYVELNRPDDARRVIDAVRARLASLPAHVRRHVELRVLQMDAEERPGDASALATYRRALDDAISAYPKDAELLMARGMAESSDPADRGQGSGASAIPYYQRAMQASPEHFGPHHYLAHAHENTGRPADALSNAAVFAKRCASVPHARHMHGHGLRRTGRTQQAIAEFEAADRLHRDYAKTESIPLEFDWHFEHNLGLLAASYQQAGRMKRAETLLKQAFALRTSLVVQAYNKREWPMFLRGRGRYAEAEKAAQALVADAHPVVSATGHIEAGLAQLAQNRWGDAANSSNAALRLLRAAPGGALAAAALQTLQGEYHLRTADRAKGRATLDEAIKRLRSAPGPDPWSQALFELESIARTARAVGDWELAARVAAQMIEHDPSYAGSHYAVALARDHAGDAAGAKAAFAAAVKAWAGADADLPELADAQRKSR